MHDLVSLVTRLSSLYDCSSLCVGGESLVCFDHVLDVVGRDYHLAVDFAHAHALLALLWTCVRVQNRPLNGNHVQHAIKIYQALPLLTRKLNLIAQGEELGYETMT